MGNKIHVMAAMEASYQFTRTHFWAFVRLGWLPLGLGLLGDRLINDPSTLWEIAEKFAIAESLPWGPLIFASSGLLLGGLAMLTSLVLLLPHWVLWIRVAAGQAAAPDGYFYFRWGRVEWLTVLSIIFFMVSTMVVALVGFGPFIAFVEARAGMDSLFEPSVNGISVDSERGAAFGPVAILLFLFGFLAFLYGAARLLLVQLIPALEGRFAPGYAIGLMAGQFRRVAYFWLLLILCGLALMIPVLIAGVIVGLVSVAAASIGPVAVVPIMVAMLVGGGLFEFLISLFILGVTAQFWFQLTARTPDVPSDGLAGEADVQFGPKAADTLK